MLVKWDQGKTINLVTDSIVFLRTYASLGPECFKDQHLPSTIYVFMIIIIKSVY